MTTLFSGCFPTEDWKTTSAINLALVVEISYNVYSLNQETNEIELDPNFSHSLKFSDKSLPDTLPYLLEVSPFSIDVSGEDTSENWCTIKLLNVQGFLNNYIYHRNGLPPPISKYNSCKIRYNGAPNDLVTGLVSEVSVSDDTVNITLISGLSILAQPVYPITTEKDGKYFYVDEYYLRPWNLGAARSFLYGKVANGVNAADLRMIDPDAEDTDGSLLNEKYYLIDDSYLKTMESTVQVDAQVNFPFMLGEVYSVSPVSLDGVVPVNTDPDFAESFTVVQEGVQYANEQYYTVCPPNTAAEDGPFSTPYIINVKSNNVMCAKLWEVEGYAALQALQAKMTPSYFGYADFIIKDVDPPVPTGTSAEDIEIKNTQSYKIITKGWRLIYDESLKLPYIKIITNIDNNNLTVDCKMSTADWYDMYPNSVTNAIASILEGGGSGIPTKLDYSGPNFFEAEELLRIDNKVPPIGYYGTTADSMIDIITYIAKSVGCIPYVDNNMKLCLYYRRLPTKKTEVLSTGVEPTETLPTSSTDIDNISYKVSTQSVATKTLINFDPIAGKLYYLSNSGTNYLVALYNGTSYMRSYDTSIESHVGGYKDLVLKPYAPIHLIPSKQFNYTNNFTVSFKLFSDSENYYTDVSPTVSDGGAITGVTIAPNAWSTVANPVLTVSGTGRNAELQAVTGQNYIYLTQARIRSKGSGYRSIPNVVFKTYSVGGAGKAVVELVLQLSDAVPGPLATGNGADGLGVQLPTDVTYTVVIKYKKPDNSIVFSTNNLSLYNAEDKVTTPSLGITTISGPRGGQLPASNILTGYKVKVLLDATNGPATLADIISVRLLSDSGTVPADLLYNYTYLNGYVKEVNFNPLIQGFSAIPVLTLEQGNYTEAAEIYFLQDDVRWPINSVSVVSGGYGYSTQPTITISGNPNLSGDLYSSFNVTSVSLSPYTPTTSPLNYSFSNSIFKFYAGSTYRVMLDCDKVGYSATYTFTLTRNDVPIGDSIVLTKPCVFSAPMPFLVKVSYVHTSGNLELTVDGQTSSVPSYILNSSTNIIEEFLLPFSESTERWGLSYIDFQRGYSGAAVEVVEEGSPEYTDTNIPLFNVDNIIEGSFSVSSEVYPTKCSCTVKFARAYSTPALTREELLNNPASTTRAQKEWFEYSTTNKQAANLYRIAPGSNNSAIETALIRLKDARELAKRLVALDSTPQLVLSFDVLPHDIENVEIGKYIRINHYLYGFDMDIDTYGIVVGVTGDFFNYKFTIKVLINLLELGE